MSPIHAAGAEQHGRCYPPPCAVETPAAPGQANLATVSEVPPAGGSSRAADARSSAPFVATGLLAVLGSLTLVALRRRSHILRRPDGPLLAPAGPPVGGPATSEPQPALR